MKRLSRSVFDLWFRGIALAFLFSCASPAGAELLPVRLDNLSSYPLSGHLERLIDPQGQLTFTDVLTPEVSRLFSPLPGNMNQGYTPATVWLRFVLERTENFPPQGYLTLWPPYLDAVTLYLQTADDSSDPAAYQKMLTGDHIPALQQQIPANDFILPLEIPAEKPRYVYLKIQSTSSVQFVGRVHRLASVIRHNNFGLQLNSAYLAAALMMALVNLMFFLRLRDRLYLYFSAYAFSLVITHASLVGMLKLIIPTQAHLLADVLTGGGICVTSATFCLVAITLFKLRQQRILYVFFTGLIGLSFLTCVSIFFGYYRSFASFLTLGLFLAIILLTLLSFRAVKQGVPGGRLYLTAFGFSNLGYAEPLLRVLGVMPAQGWSVSLLQTTTLINLIFMALALIERFHAKERKAVISAQASEQVARDLAEEMTVELRAALEQQNEAMERQARFLAMISHEYRTPLAIIQANLNLLEQDGPRHTERESRLGAMKHALARLVELMEVSLREERLGDFGARIKRTEIVLTELLDEVIDKAEGLWPERTFIFNPSPATRSVVDGDMTQLRAAIFNLIENACKYSGTETPIVLECQDDGETLTVLVKDWGVGVADEETASLFGKYQRGKSTADVGGAGLGLWLVRQIVEQHGGRVELRSHGEGGTCATLRLPKGKTG